MSDNGNENRFDRIERAIENLTGEVRSLAGELRIEVQMRREEIAHEREMRQRLAQDHYALHDEFKEQHRILMTAQVIMAEEIREMSKEMKEHRESMKELRESQKLTDEKLGILMHMMDNFIREQRNGRAGPPPA